MNKFQMGDKVQFIDNYRNRDYWLRYYKQSFDFDTIVLVSKIEDDCIRPKECQYGYWACKTRFEKVIQKGQLQLPFKGRF